FFFFSSRRRHTRFSRDWSSDVCSSDLVTSRSSLVSEETAVPVASLRIKNIFIWYMFESCLRKWFRIEIMTLLLTFLLQSAIHHRSEERRVGKECRSRLWRNH